MFYRIRQTLTALFFSSFVVLAWMIYAGHLSIFREHPSPSDTLTTAFYLLSTVVQSLAAIGAITIAVLFITAQITGRHQYTRMLIEIYSDPTIILTLFFFLLGITVGTLTLGMIALVVQAKDYWVLDLNILIAITAIILLIPAVLVQLENINPYLLAVKLSKRITPNRIQSYHLVQIEADPVSPHRLHYALKAWGHLHGRHDPLGPFHEVLMGAVQSHDRIQVSALTRLLLQRVARYCGVPYRKTATDIFAHPSVASRVWNQLYIFIRSPAPPTDQIAMLLHIMHYVVRRAQNLRREWGDLDTIRKQFVLNVADLIQSLRMRSGVEQLVEICLYATMHICFGYANVKPYGQYEPLSNYYGLAEELAASGSPDQAELCVQILAFLAERTNQLPVGSRRSFEWRLSSTLRAYRGALVSARKQADWLPGSGQFDPWRYKISEY